MQVDLWKVLEAFLENFNVNLTLISSKEDDITKFDLGIRKILGIRILMRRLQRMSVTLVRAGNCMSCRMFLKRNTVCSVCRKKREVWETTV